MRADRKNKDPQMAKMLAAHGKWLGKHVLQQTAGLGRATSVCGLHTSPVFCRTLDVKGDDYQYIHKSKVPSMHFQKSLLRLPIPELDKTCDRYLRSQKAILSDEEYQRTEQAVAQFRSGPGPALQYQLKNQDKANKHTSYISGPWFDMYLSDRAPLVLNYNPFLALSPEERPGYADPLIRATNTLVASLRIMRTLRDNVLEPVVYHLNPAKSDTPLFRKVTGWTPSAISAYAAYAFKAFPLDMSQFGNLFNSTRIPEIGKDRLRCDPKARHMLITKNGHFYIFDVFDRDGNILSPEHVYACVSYIYNDPTPPPQHSIAIFSTENRDTWAKCRAELVEAGNEGVLNALDTAAFNIVFDKEEVGMDPYKMYHTFLHGDGDNRWFDKSFSLIFTADGQLALNFEHAWGDGVAVMSYFNEMTKELANRPHIHPDTKPASIDASQYVKRLEFTLTPSLEAAIDKARQHYEANTSALHVNVLDSSIFGKNFCKKHKISPDAVMQLGFQAAYYLQNGHVAATYESCSTAAFKHGRTETVRPATLETTAFVKAIAQAQPPSDSELKKMLMECSKVHGNLTKEAAMGQGFDRHLFGLRKLAEAQGSPLPELFTDPSYAKINHIIISTSTLPSAAIMFGGFAPVVRDGFGVGYQIKDDSLGIVLSSYPPPRDGAGFLECAEKAYKLIHDVLSTS
uniref:Carnitine O-palmitoyltransferase 2 n=1 Tax=Eriocheir sinensis TaxID=95602 RepID=A0A385IU68_ERISI|nr:carnitine O-palmitoyltransferase 2 [Eriocheir sinensis]